MLRNFDVRLKAILDHMVEDKLNGVSLSGTYFARSSWIRKRQNLYQEISSISDPDAAEIYPELIKVFENAKEDIMAMGKIASTKKDELLYSLSQQQSSLGLEKRLRMMKVPLNGGSNTSQGSRHKAEPGKDIVWIDDREP